MKDLRQTRKYASYMSCLGWHVVKNEGVYCYVKKIPIIGSYVKIQRPGKPISAKSINKIAKDNRAYQIFIEPSNNFQYNYYLNKGFKVAKHPSLPSKTVYINLKSNGKTLLSKMHHKTRYNIGLAKRKGLTVESSTDIDLFNREWHIAAKRRKMFLSLRNHIDALFLALNNQVTILNAYRDKNLIAGVLLVRTSSVAYYMYAFSTPEGNKTYAPTLLVWESLLWAKRNKCLNFDFEGIFDARFPLKTWKGFTRFKNGFGGDEIEFQGPLTKYYLPFGW